MNQLDSGDLTDSGANESQEPLRKDNRES